MPGINLGNVNTPATAAELVEFRRALGLPTVLAQSGIGIPHTGSTAPFALLNVTIPGGSMGPNGVLEFFGRFTETNNPNNKTLIIRMSGTPFFQAGDSGKPGREVALRAQNAGSVGSQKLGWTGTALPLGSISSSAVLATSSFNTDVDQTLQIVVTLANAADTFTLECFQAVVWYGA